MRETRVGEKQGSRLSRMAVLAFWSGIASWPVGSLFSIAWGIFTIPHPCPIQKKGELTAFVCVFALVMCAVAVVLGGLAVLRIQRSQGRLKGLWYAKRGVILAVVLGTINVYGLIALPAPLVRRELEQRDQALRTLHQAEEKYRVLYPDIGYSPDLRSLGPPATRSPSSADRAGLVKSYLAAGLYCHGKELLSYEPRTAADGKIVGYAVRAEWRGGIKVMDETGEVRFVSKPFHKKKPRSAKFR